MHSVLRERLTMAKVKADTLELFSDIKFIYDGLLERSEGQSLSALDSYFGAPNTIPHLDGKTGVRTYAKIMDWAFFGNTKAGYPIYSADNYRAIKPTAPAFTYKDFGAQSPDTTSKILQQFQTYPAENELALNDFKIYRPLAPVATIYRDLRTAQRLLMKPLDGAQAPQVSWTWTPESGSPSTETRQNTALGQMLGVNTLFSSTTPNHSGYASGFSGSVNFHKIKSGYMLPIFNIRTSAAQPQSLKYVMWPMQLTPTATGF